ncbi:MAG: pentapeptide repeat-containing protein [Cyanobacteria bacterium P01_H01_bin.105]
MRLLYIVSRCYHWLRPTELEKVQIRQYIASQLRHNRSLLKRSGTVWDDEKKARQISNNLGRRLLFRLNQTLISVERRGIEPFTWWLARADFFQAMERLSPTLEAIGVIAIPFVLFLATQRYEENLQQRELERLRQEAVTGYLEQLSTIMLDLDGNLLDPENAELRTLTTAATMATLTDPNLNGERRTQILRFLSRTGLVHGDRSNYSPSIPDKDYITLNFQGLQLMGTDLSFTIFGPVSFENADLNRANLQGADLNRANLRSADLRGTNLNSANLDSANLRGAFLDNANLKRADLDSANLQGASLVRANLQGADLNRANLQGASLVRANLRGAFLVSANLQGASLVSTNLRSAILCRTKIPNRIDINPDKDCNQFGIDLEKE